MGAHNAVVFDLWDTLTEPIPQRERDRVTAEVGALLGADGPAFATLVANTFPERCRGELGDLEATLRALCRELDVQPMLQQVASASEHRMLAQAGLLRLRQDAGPTVGRFHRHGWRIGLLTDSTCETETLWRGLEISRLFDTAVFSCAEGRSKPDRLLFETVVERLGVAPERCVYVADGRSGELSAAAAFGMRPIQLDVGQTGAEEWYGVRVPDLTTVADLVLEADGFPSS